MESRCAEVSVDVLSSNATCGSCYVQLSEGNIVVYEHLECDLRQHVLDCRSHLDPHYSPQTTV